MAITYLNSNIIKMYYGGNTITQAYLNGDHFFPVSSDIPQPILYFDADSYDESAIVTGTDNYRLLTDLVDGAGEFWVKPKYEYSNGYLQMTNNGSWAVALYDANKTVPASMPMSVEFYADIQGTGCIFMASQNWTWNECFAIYSQLNGTQPFLNINITHASDDWTCDWAHVNFDYGLHHFIMVRDVTNNQFLTYMDGSLINTTTYTGSADVGAMGLIREIWNENVGAEGGFKHLKMYNTALTADQVSNIYNNL